MSNMSYCRFENTASDLRDCADHIHNKLSNAHEIEAKKRLIKTCIEILNACENIEVNIIDPSKPVTVEEYDDEG